MQYTTPDCEWMTTSHPQMITVDFALVQITRGASLGQFTVSLLQSAEPYGSPLLSTGQPRKHLKLIPMEMLSTAGFYPIHIHNFSS